jgi:hypothetical protein
VCLEDNSIEQQWSEKRTEVYTIVVFNEVIEEHAGHRDGATGEIWIVVHPITQFDTSRRIYIAGKERE